MAEQQQSFTPGPWLTAGCTVYALDETKSCNRFSARVEGGWQWRSSGMLGASGDRTSEPELEANARLIAAAPTFADIASRAQYLANTRGGDYDSLSRDELLGFMVEYDDALASAQAAK